MGRMSKRKGQRIELELVHLHQEHGIPCKRQPLSGALGGSFRGDLIVADGLRAEVKARGQGDSWKTLARWLGEDDLLFLRQDRQRPLVVMTWETYVHLVQIRTEPPPS